MLFALALDSIAISDSNGIRKALSAAFGKEGFTITPCIRPQLNDAPTLDIFIDRSRSLVRELFGKSQAQVCVGLTSGLLLESKSHVPIRVDYALVLIMSTREILAAPLNTDCPEQLRRIKRSPSMAPESIERFVSMLDSAIAPFLSS